MTPLIAQIAAKKAEVDALALQLKDYIKDTSIDLDERWSVYTQAVNDNIIVDHERFGDGYGGILLGSESRFSCYDTFYMERHEARDFPDILESYEEDPEDDRFDGVTPETIIAWKEKVLSTGKSGFKYDW